MRNRYLKRADWFTVVLYLIMVIFGWLNIYAVNREPDSVMAVFFNPDKEYIKQLIWLAISLIFAGVIMLMDSKFFVEFAYILYAVSCFLLILVIFVGVEINSAKSWFQIGGISFQPIELAKVTTSLSIARIVSRFQFSFKNFSHIIRLGFIILFPILITVVQNDIGSGMVFFALFIPLFREGMSPYLFLFGFIAIAVFILTLLIPNYVILILLSLALIVKLLFMKNLKDVLIIVVSVGLMYLIGRVFIYEDSTAINHNLIILSAMLAASILIGLKALFKRLKIVWVFLLFFWGGVGFAYSSDYFFEEVLSDYQRSRIKVMVGLEQDPLGTGYNVNQSKIAIGSGGLTGKGFLQGTQTKFSFVPEQSTDFIFCTVGEEWGFIGTTGVVLLFMILLFRLIILSERQHSAFSRIYGYAVASLFFFHFTVNIGMTIGLAPVIGIPLPFFSYGGSSLLGFTIMLFIFLKLDTNRAELIR